MLYKIHFSAFSRFGTNKFFDLRLIIVFYYFCEILSFFIYIIVAKQVIVYKGWRNLNCVESGCFARRERPNRKGEMGPG